MSKFEKIYEEFKQAINEDVDLLNMERVIKSYLKTALWSSNDEKDDNGGEPMDKNYDIDDFTSEAKKRAEKDCKKFITDLEKEVNKYNKSVEDEDDKVLISNLDDTNTTSAANYEKLGHNFWLTRNGHGSGFADGDYPEPIEKILTKLSEKAGPVDLYVTDDNKIDMS